MPSPQRPVPMEDLAMIVIARRCFSGHPIARAQGGNKGALASGRPAAKATALRAAAARFPASGGNSAGFRIGHQPMLLHHRKDCGESDRQPGLKEGQGSARGLPHIDEKAASLRLAAVGTVLRLPKPKRAIHCRQLAGLASADRSLHRDSRSEDRTRYRS